MIQRATHLAQTHLAPTLPERWLHTQAVAHKVASIAPRLLTASQTEIATAAAWLHDIGYAPAIRQTGFHPLDGALWLQTQKIDPRITALVAHHSCADIEAEERHLAAQLCAFPQPEPLAADILHYADLTTGPQGQDFTPQQRINEILARYGANDLVANFTRKTMPQRLALAARMESLLSPP